VAKLIAGAAAALLISLSSAASPALSVDSTAPGTDGAPVRADLNGDKLFDDLQARLARMDSGDRVSVIVTLKAPATASRVGGVERTVGAFAVSRRFKVIPSFTATLTKAQVQALARLAVVAHVEQNAVVHALNDSAQASFGVAKARVDAGVNGNADGNAGTYSKNDLVAAVVDTGIDTNHLDLDQGKVIGWRDIVNGKATPYDDNGHGTHVSASIAGDGDARPDRLYQGVAPGAALVGVKVLNNVGTGSMSDVAAGIDWVVQNKDTYGIEAINLSVGSTGCNDGTDAASVAVNNAAAAGLVVVVAAGNSGPGTCTIDSPGAAASALTAGAMADLGPKGFKQAYFSGRGPTADGRIKPDISAPGVDITSADAGTTNGYVTESGTSMATPFVVGVALLMLNVNAGLTPAQVKSLMMQSAQDWARGGDNKTAGSSGADVDYGAGRLDAYAAIKAAGAQINSPPAVPTHRELEGTLSGGGAQLDYQLSVTTTAFPIAATMVMPGVSAGVAYSPNFNLYLFDPSGAQVASSASARRQDDLGYQPTTTGTYTLRVRSSIGSGGFVVDVSAGLGAPPPDTTPPSVTSLSPADGAASVVTSTSISVSFSEAMNTSATQGAFSLVNVGGTSLISGTFSWSGNTMTFTPSLLLLGGTQYSAKVAGGSGGAKDTAGNALAADRTWSFTTASAAAGGFAFPSGVSVLTGTVRGGSAASLNADDDTYFLVTSSFTTPTAAWYGAFTGLPVTAKNLKVTYKGKNSVTCTQTVAIWRWATSSWIQLDSRSVGGTEVAIADLAPPGAASDYVSSTGEVRARVRCTAFSPFTESGDLLKLAYDA
jgi:serine protease AprX